MDDSYGFWMGLSRILGLLFWLWLFWFISEKIREKERRTQAQLEELRKRKEVPPKTPDEAQEDIDTWKKRLRTLWSGNGPEVMFGYTKADGTSLGRRRRVHLRALVTHPEMGMYLRGETPRNDNESYFKVSRINTSIALDDGMIPVADFLGMLREDKFEALREPRPRATAENAPAKPRPNSKPGKPELPRIDTRAERAKATMELDAAGWRKEGSLSLSGYRVGRARGRPANIRQRILNTILLYDDLLDVPERAYAAEWGRPASRQRYKKMHDSIKTFLNNARKRHGLKDMSTAIKDWESDLIYMERTLKRQL